MKIASQSDSRVTRVPECNVVFVLISLGFHLPLQNVSLLPFVLEAFGGYVVAIEGILLIRERAC